MDLNYLLHRHQVSLMRADAAPSAVVRDVHREFAAAYAARVRKAADASGAGTAPLAYAR